MTGFIKAASHYIYNTPEYIYAFAEEQYDVAKETIQKFPRDFLWIISEIAITIIGIVAMSYLSLVPHGDSDDDSEYSRVFIDGLLSNPTKAFFVVSVIIPVIEEVAFRGFLQTLVAESIYYIAPDRYKNTEGDAPSPAEVCSKKISYLVSSIIFGAAHISNDHPLSKVQAFLAAIGGYKLSHLKTETGLIRCVVNHGMHNFIVFSLAYGILKLS